MAQLTRRDLRTLLRCLGEIYAHPDLETFPTHLLTVLPQVVPSEITGYNEVNLRGQRNAAVMEPPDTHWDEQIFAQLMHENPLIVYYQRTHDSRAYKISDFLTQRQFHRLALYNEFYRRLGVERQMVVRLPSPPPLIIGVALTRSRRDFSEQERLLLNLLRPHLIQAYHQAEAVTQLRQELSVLRQTIEECDRGVIVLTDKGRVQSMTERARQWVKDYFGKACSHQAHHLPENLQGWVTHQELQLAQEDKVPSPRQPLVVEHEGKRLVVRFVGDRVEGRYLLLLEEQRTAFSVSSLEPLSLTRRETEVLFWVAQGKTNPEIGTILGVSARTVQTHLEHVYRKLGVETRTAATMQALEMLGLLRR